MSTAGMWVDGTDLHFFDAQGVEWHVTGTVANGTGHAGIFINAQGVLSYVDAAGTTRVVPYVTAAGAGQNGALWVDQFVHWVAGGTTYTLHADVAYTDGAYADHVDHTNYSDAFSGSNEALGESYADFTDHYDYTDAGTYQDFHEDASAPSHHADQHGDYYTDGAGGAGYQDAYTDGSTNPNQYGDTHSDATSYSDSASWHFDYVYQTAYGDDTASHYDYSTYSDYADNPHSDVPHSDAPTQGA